ncbi:MAG: response regulator transcription factor [Anaerolineales bacterium]|nr:response regulator transcription factor [Anaerolineales bacterium]
MNTIRLLLVDDHDVVRTGLKAYLDTQDGLLVVGEASSGREAMQQASELKPDVIVMDITMPDMDGLEATRKLKSLMPNCHVLALTVHEDKRYLFEMVAAGATGYLTKQAAAEELVSAIRTVATGNVYLQPILARWLLDDYRRLLTESSSSDYAEDEAIDEDKLKALSRREIQVLELVAEGLTNPQIGKKLDISPKTVARHRERIMQKINLHSSTELVKFAIRTGIIDIHHNWRN